MTFSEFTILIKKLQKAIQICKSTNSINIDLYSNLMSSILELFELHFGEEKTDTLFWFLYYAKPEDCSIYDLYMIIILDKDLYNSPSGGHFFILHPDEIRKIINEEYQK